MESLIEHLKSFPARVKVILAVVWAASILAAASLTLVAVLILEGGTNPGQTGATEIRPVEDRDHTDLPFLYHITGASENVAPVPRSGPVADVPAPAPRKTVPPPVTPAVSTPPAETVPPPTGPTVAVAGVLERALEIDSLLESGADDDAARKASSVFDEYRSYQALTDGLLAEGIGETRAQLLSLRLLQAAGHEETSRDVARELRRSYAGTTEVSETVRRFKILRPRVISIDPSVRGGRYLTATGTVENPDITSVRNVIVQVVALDAAGNRIGTVTTRVKPRRLAAESSGTFKAAFKGLDPDSIMRTRAAVLEFEYEVSGGE